MKGIVEIVKARLYRGSYLATVVGFGEGMHWLGVDDGPQFVGILSGEHRNLGDGHRQCGQFLYLNFKG